VYLNCQVGWYDSFTLKAASDTGDVIWETNSTLVASRLAVDRAGDVYVTGTAQSPANGTDWMTIEYDTNGNQLWVQTYNGPANGNDGAIAIAIAPPDGSIYVTGYSANTSGGIDITTIKYLQSPTIQPQPGGAMLLQLPGVPGQSSGLGATTDLVNWLELGPVVAGTNGLFQFTDTNAPLYPSRFYHWHSP
jgi:hypothetical protein